MEKQHLRASQSTASRILSSSVERPSECHESVDQRRDQDGGQHHLRDHLAKQQLGDLILRPQVAGYNAVSQALQAELQSALLGDKDPQRALDDAASKASSLLGG